MHFLWTLSQRTFLTAGLAFFLREFFFSRYVINSCILHTSVNKKNKKKIHNFRERKFTSNRVIAAESWCANTTIAYICIHWYLYIIYNSSGYITEYSLIICISLLFLSQIFIKLSDGIFVDLFISNQPEIIYHYILTIIKQKIRNLKYYTILRSESTEIGAHYSL